VLNFNRLRRSAELSPALDVEKSTLLASDWWPLYGSEAIPNDKQRFGM
jgi:hypothetical protein